MTKKPGFIVEFRCYSLCQGTGDEFRTFRLGLFGLEKLHHPDRTLHLLAEALDKMGVAPAP
jgi:hypothetical protein